MPSPQTPVNSPFGYRSTASEVAEQVDLAGRYVVVTGGYSGIGTETVRALAGAGAKVIVGARREAQAREVLDSFEGDIAILPLDLADPQSIDSFARLRCRAHRERGHPREQCRDHGQPAGARRAWL